MRLSRLLWQVPTALFSLAALFLLANEYAIARGSRRTKNITYLSTSHPDFDAERHVLDVYAPQPTLKKPGPVVVFIHGGAWNSGHKNMYSFIGRRLAKLGVTAVVINYRLAPSVHVPEMASDCAQAVYWTQQHIAEYGGDPNQMFVMGHSAGGGLAALLATNRHLFSQLGLAQSPVKGAILDDPAGLDMFDYLKKMEYPGDAQYLIPFGKDPSVWRAVSPLYFLSADSPPMLLYVGERTYPGIASSTRKFNSRLTELGIKHEFAVQPGKKHIPMVTQLFWTNNLIYQGLLKFLGLHEPGF